MHKVGILRGPNLNQFEGQYLERLPSHGFEPIGIATNDNNVDISTIHFSVRRGKSYKTLTQGPLKPFISFVGRIAGYNMTSLNYRFRNLKGLTSDLDLIYSADMWYPFTYQAVKTKIPTIIMEWENIPFNVKSQPYVKIKEYTRIHAKHFVAITQKAKEALITEGVKPKLISVVPAGIDCDKFEPAAPSKELIKKFGLSESKIKIIFVGRLVPEKGIFDLLEAFSALRQKNEKVELLIVGSGTAVMQAQINQLLLQLKIKDRVNFLGKVDYSQMPLIHNLADVFCLPSVPTSFWAEQFGYSMVEAMACGKPVVSTLSGSIPEIVKNRSTGILVQPNDPHGLESALQELVLDKQKRDIFGSNGRKWVLEQFEADKVAQHLAEIFDRFV